MLADGALFGNIGQYEVIQGTVNFTLDPKNSANDKVVDIAYAPVNQAGLVEFSADLTVVVPLNRGKANGTLIYEVNNRGGIRLGQTLRPDNPLTDKGFTFLATGWIAEIEPRQGRLRLRAPVIGSPIEPVTGSVRYEIIVSQAIDSANIAGARHMSYEPTDAGMRHATLTYRTNQLDQPIPIERSEFELQVSWPEGANQPVVTMKLSAGLQPGFIYELIYEAKNPVLQGAGLAGIRDIVSLFKQGAAANQSAALADSLAELQLPDFQQTIAYGVSQSGRLLRLFLYDGFNQDLQGRRVFDGVIPVIAGGGMGMFNHRFAMPTRTNNQHENYLFPNDLFPFTYGDSKDPFTGKADGILAKARRSNTVPRIMHIQTSNEYWQRAGSLAHTNPAGTKDAVIPDEVRFYTIGGSQHGSGSGIPRPATAGQLPANPNMHAPITRALIVAMHKWLATGQLPPAARYPRISDNNLAASRSEDHEINPRVWNRIPSIQHPTVIYRPGRADYGERYSQSRIVDHHPATALAYYNTLVPTVNSDNNDFAKGTILPPLTSVPLGTFTSWNLRSPSVGSHTELLRLAGGYIPFYLTKQERTRQRDPRLSIEERYQGFDDYFAQYETATDALIEEGFLLPGDKAVIMDIARKNRPLFE